MDCSLSLRVMLVSFMKQYGRIQAHYDSQNLRFYKSKLHKFSTGVMAPYVFLMQYIASTPIRKIRNYAQKSELHLC